MTNERFLSPDFPSHEAQRQWYLRQLGIRSYYPRFVLPGAAPSPEWETSGAAVKVQPGLAPVAEAPRRTTAPAAPASSSERGSQGGSLRKLLADEKPAMTPAPQPSVAAAPQANTRSQDSETRETPRFRVLLLRAGRGLAICCQVPLQGQAALGAAEQRLLQNILAWLGAGLESSRPREFPWPPRGIDPGPGDPVAQASSSLFAFLEQGQQEQGFTRLLLMGTTVSELLQNWQEATGRAVPWQAFRCHSPGEMLAQPLLKRDTWQALQALHRLLQSA